MNAIFSRHCDYRISERLSMSKTEIATILNSEKTVDIGIEQGSRRLHRLFFSKRDQFCFLAVQDMKNGTVVTVIPADDRGSTRHVSVDAQLNARALIEKHPSCIQEVERDAVGAAYDGKIERVKFICYIISELEQVKILRFTVCSEDIGETQLNNLLDQDKFKKRLIKEFTRAAEQKSYIISGFQSIYIQVKNEEMVLVEDRTACSLLTSIKVNGHSVSYCAA